MSSEISLKEFIEAWKELEVKEAKRDFKTHLAAYIIINSFLAFVNLWTSQGTIWFIWPLAGWGIGVAFHAYFARSSEVAGSIETKALQIEMYARKKKG
ncbi:MAG: 2TM domain-containing protein [Sulfolobales archaeon]|nr:2TM domain-containing protein [Sulfolobales archaeon]MCX8198993.1 2TM domain-containing protein [Sulfolobales archaeon]MDW8169972.1 2TM domain-containing protein [Desulfurococcaceae archaeon]